MADELTTQELKQARILATIARDVYNPDPHETEGWQRLSDDEINAIGISAAFLNETLSSQIARKDGLRAGLYRTEDNALVLAFAGTHLTSTRDWITNIRQGLGLETDEYSKAAMLARQFSMVVGPKYITGHSKGGAIASLASALTLSEAVTFNTAGVHKKPLEREGVDYQAFKKGAAPTLISNIVVEGEAVQKVNGLPIVPEPLGPIFSISGETIGDMNSFGRHSIDSVIETIDDELFSRDSYAIEQYLKSEEAFKSKPQTRRPTVFLIAGPNGAGKSTLYRSIIGPKITTPFINADIIQKEELRDPSMNASYTARDMAIERREEYLKQGKSFVFETVFSHESKLKEIPKYKEAGFNVVLYHIGLKTADISVDRVKQRVKKGGHNVPEDKIRARFERNQPLIKQAVFLADRAFVYDNSIDGKAIKLGVEFENGKVVSIGENLLKWQRDLYKDELTPFSAIRQNPAAASFDVIRRMAQEAEGRSVKVEIPKPGYKYTGPLVGESAMHYLQRTEHQYVGHFKSVLSADLKLGNPLEIEYKTRRKASITDLELPAANDQNQKKKMVNENVKLLPQISEVSILGARSLIITHSASAAEQFKTDEIRASKAGNDEQAQKASASIKALKLAKPLLDTLRIQGVSKLGLQGQTNTPPKLVNSILKSAFAEYQNRGLGKDVYSRTADLDR